MLLKIFYYNIEDFNKYCDFIKSQNLIKLKIEEKKYYLKLNSISKLEGDYVKFEYSLFIKNIKNDRINLFSFYFGLKSKVLFFEISSDMSIFFYKFLKNYEKYLQNNDIYVHFKEIIVERKKMWDFIITSNPINLEIITEKGLVELTEEWNLEKQNLDLDLQDYPISWAQLIYKEGDLLFQFHYYLDEINIPDYIEMTKISSFFKSIEEVIL